MLQFVSSGLFLLLSFAFLIVPHASGQIPTHSSTEPIQITGLVRYAATGRPADEIIVRLQGLSGGYVGEVRTDRLGKFRFTGLVPIQYQLDIRHPGYQEIQREVNLVMVSSEYLQLSLVAEKPSGPLPPPPSKLVVDANVTPEARKEYEKAESLLANQGKDRIAEAVIHLEKAVLIYPNFLEAQLKLGTGYMDLDEWAKAESALRRALEINPRTANADFALGELYSRQEKYKQAEDYIRQGLAIEDRSWQGRFALARLYWIKGETLKASRQLAIALQLNPDFADAHLLAGNIFLRVNRPQDAILEFQEYLRLAPHGQYANQAKTSIEKLKSISSLKN